MPLDLPTLCLTSSYRRSQKIDVWAEVVPSEVRDRIQWIKRHLANAGMGIRRTDVTRQRGHFFRFAAHDGRGLVGGVSDNGWWIIWSISPFLYCRCAVLSRSKFVTNCCEVIANRSWSSAFSVHRGLRFSALLEIGDGAFVRLCLKQATVKNHLIQGRQGFHERICDRSTAIPRRAESNS